MVFHHSSLKPAGSIRRRPKDASMHRMPLSRDDRKSREVFARKYGKPLSRVERERERLVFGGNFGCDGYTTPAQAAALPVQLELAPGRWLLDLGSGRGWPGLYLAKLTGCRTVLADLGNLAEPMPVVAAAGVWLTRDYRFTSTGKGPVTRGSCSGTPATTRPS